MDKIIAYKYSGSRHAQGSCALPTAPANYTLRYTSSQGDIVASVLEHPQKRLTEAEVSQIILAYQSGQSANELARLHGCHRHTICNQLQKHGVELSNKKIKTEEQSEEIVGLYERGLSIAKVAKLTGLSTPTIQRHLHRQNVEVRGGRNINDSLTNS